QTPLWNAVSLLTSECDTNRVKQFNVLRFGAPCLIETDPAHVLVAFWCVENCVSNIRWLRLKV
ncbi:MAG: hypothetical protein ABIH23_14380, partial [bacterium]